MHIGFDVSQSGSGKAGCGFYALQLARALREARPAHRFTFYRDFGDFWFDPRMAFARPLAGAAYGPRHFGRGAAAAFWNAPDVEARLGRPDVIHANNFWCPLQLAEARLVYTCYDLGFLVEPSWTTEANRAGCLEGVFRASLAADWIVAISEATREHFLATFPHFPADRVRVVHPFARFGAAGQELAERRPAKGGTLAEGRFFLNVGTIEPRKNQHRLVEAYARYLALGGEAMPLVLAGGRGWLMDDFARHVERLGIAKHVVMTGYVDDAELAWLYRHCFANLYPSRFEGFGMPVLEGLALGAASLVSSAPALPEVAGHAALLVAPEDVEGWAQAMLALSRDAVLRARLREAAPAQAARFTGAGAAAALLALYEEAAATPKRVPPLASAA